MKLRLLTAALVAVGSIAAEAAPKKVLVVTATKGFRHSSIATAENVIATLGETSGAFTDNLHRLELRQRFGFG